MVNSSAIVSSSTASYFVPNSDCTLLLKAVLGQLSQRFALQVIFPTARTGTVEKVANCPLSTSAIPAQHG